MSDNDSFIEEVNEEVRRDRLYKYVRRYGWIAVVLVVGVVGVTGFLEYQKAQSVKAAQALGDKLVAALDAEEPQARADALAGLAGVKGKAQVIVELRRAAELVLAGDQDAALAVYDAIAAGGADPVYADMAALKALVLRGSSMEKADRDAALEQLAAPGAIYRPLAMEQQAIAALDADNREKAIEIYTTLYQDSETGNALRNRATQMLVALGAEVPERAQLLSE